MKSWIFVYFMFFWLHCCSLKTDQKRYLLYDVNPPEGFNLRRDVYMRMANIVRIMRRTDPSWTLVLAPFSSLYHWRSVIDQEKVRWSTFFDVKSLSKLVPIIEFDDFISNIRELNDFGQNPPFPLIEQYYELQNDKEFFKTGVWREGVSLDDCAEESDIRLIGGVYRGKFYSYTDMAATDFNCVTVSADIETFSKWLLNTFKGDIVMLGHAEVIIHGKYSEWSAEWWEARRSMRYSKKLVEIANKFRSENLNSTDVDDITQLPDDWRLEKANMNDAVGGPYACAHWRRADYVVAYPEKTPGPGPAARQLKKWLRKYSLHHVYLSTDTNDMEVLRLSKLLEEESIKVHRYKPDRATLLKILDGGQAIIDQIICSHARLFVGTYSSTFSFRIQEDRMIAGFSSGSTFNRFHGENEVDPEPPTQWQVVYPIVSVNHTSSDNHDEL